jgi:mgtE-like transporter
MFAKVLVKQSLPLLIICGFGGIIAGSTFGFMKYIFETIPGLIVIVPGVIALRGNISTAFGSRLGSAYHLGVIDKDNIWNTELKQNIFGSLILSCAMSAIIGVLAYGTSLLLGVHPNALVLISIVLIAGVTSGAIQTLMTILIVFLVFKKGYDPDNITGPALATFGDIITMLCIFGSAIVVGGLA